MRRRRTRCAAFPSERFLMSKKSTPMTPQASRRIASATSKANDGKIPPGSFASRAGAIVQKTQAASHLIKNKAS